MTTPLVRPTMFLLLLPVISSPLAAQSLLERPPNISGNWTGPPGTLHFNFVHRFSASRAPERKVSNVPTMLLAAGLPRALMAGFNYSSNSTLAPRYPNEWELFVRWAPLAADAGAPFDVGGQLGYNSATDGMDGELSIARRLGRVRLLAAGRALSNPADRGATQFAFGGGAAVRLGTHLALTGDLSTVAGNDTAKRTAWSAGVHMALPFTPHTLSLHASNSATTTLQGISRGTRNVRYGFEFTVPITLRRYFGRPAAASPAAAQQQDTASAIVRTGMRNSAYSHTRLEITVGTTVEWTNQDALPHTVSAVDKSFDSGLIGVGGRWRHTFTRAGTYDFYCMPHPFMKGTIVVKPM